MRFAPWALLIASCAAIGCTPVPSFDGTTAPVDQNAAYPQLVPLAPLLAQVNAAPQQITPASVANTNARIAGLQGRANRLRGPVIDAATRARMQQSIANSALR